MLLFIFMIPSFFLMIILTILKITDIKRKFSKIFQKMPMIFMIFFFQKIEEQGRDPGEAFGKIRWVIVETNRGRWTG